jgi:hypothetical protein
MRKSMLDHGVWSDVKIGGEHLRLFSEQSTFGVQASVYNMIAKNWVAPVEAADDIEQGKDRAAAHAREYLYSTVHLELPPLKWKKGRLQ